MRSSIAGTVLAGPVLALLCGCDAEPSRHREAPTLDKKLWTAENPISCDSSDFGAVTDLAATLGAGDPSVPEEGLASYGGRIEADPVRLDNLAELRSSPWATACFAGNLAARADLSTASRHPSVALIADAASALGVALEVGGAFPVLDAGAPLADALTRVDGVVDLETAVSLTKLPLGFQSQVARLVVAASEAAKLRDEALRLLATEAPLARYFDDAPLAWLEWNFADPAAAPEFDPGTQFQAYLRTGRGAAALYEGGARLAQAIDEMDVGIMRASDVPADFDLVVSTRLGLVVLRGGGDDTYDPALDPRLDGPILLVVDSGGDDTYRIPAGATVSAEHAVSINVDLGGNDLYTYAATDAGSAALAPSDSSGRYSGSGRGPFSLSNQGRQGSGRLGYGFLVDLGQGRDRYESLRMSQGFAALGVGMLWDDGGDDRYTAEAAAQASALGGIAILHDGGGDDDYRSFSRSQGFAAVSSSAALFDASGDDHYELVVDDVVLVGSSQTNGAVNISLGQGTAMGWRDDTSGNHLGGGVALLRDRDGDDAYIGGTFAQGTGYWMGVGVFADGGGNDAYDAAFYGQGAAAHFAIAAFLEAGGNDRYGLGRPPIQSALGLGHDFSMGVFVDRAGHDRYRAPPWGLGASTCRGVGLAVEIGGDDEYTSVATDILGATEDVCSAEPTWPTFGLFVDAGGNDSYRSRGDNDQSWSTGAPAGAPWFAGGLDRNSGTTGAYETLFAHE